MNKKSGRRINFAAIVLCISFALTACASIYPVKVFGADSFGENEVWTIEAASTNTSFNVEFLSISKLQNNHNKGDETTTNSKIINAPPGHYTLKSRCALKEASAEVITEVRGSAGEKFLAQCKFDTINRRLVYLDIRVAK